MQHSLAKKLDEEEEDLLTEPLSWLATIRGAPGGPSPEEDEHAIGAVAAACSGLLAGGLDSRSRWPQVASAAPLTIIAAQYMRT